MILIEVVKLVVDKHWSDDLLLNCQRESAIFEQIRFAGLFIVVALEDFLSNLITHHGQ